MSRAYRFSDFQAFLRNHSEASPARHSGHEDRLPLDRGSREGSPIERRAGTEPTFTGTIQTAFARRIAIEIASICSASQKSKP